MGELASRYLDPVIERRAGMTLDLVSSWETIAGPRWAAAAHPERLDWPQRSGEEGGFEPAVLKVVVTPAQALWLSHDCDALIARVNGWFGFAAVSRVAIRQGPLPDRGERPKAEPARIAEPPSAAIAAITDDRLRAAFTRMEAGLRRKSARARPK